MIFLLIASAVTAFFGDVRLRAADAWPTPRGVTEDHWAGNSLFFYQRIRFSVSDASFVLLTEKDPGEEWCDLIAGGAGYRKNEWLAAAGMLRVQFATGLVLSSAGQWASADPLSLSKPVSWRIRLEPSESPGDNDPGGLVGAGAQFTAGRLSLASVAASRRADPGGTGLHRSPAEIASRGSLRNDLLAFRAGWGSVGITLAGISSRTDSARTEGLRFGADINLTGDTHGLVGEIALEGDSVVNFIASASRGTPSFRHGVTVSRNISPYPEGSHELGSTHRAGAGYGFRLRLLPNLLMDTGMLYLDKGETANVKAGVQMEFSPGGRTEIGSRLSLSSSSADETTLSGRLTASWSPGRNTTLSLKLPYSAYRSEDENQFGAGLEARLRHRTLYGLEYSLSAAAAETDGWPSRVYAYNLSFPGEFGSRALYGSSALLQGAVSMHISEQATIRVKTGWYTRRGEESLGTGYETTEGPSRTWAALQFDCKFR
jgi:hypothetical protein